MHKDLCLLTLTDIRYTAMLDYNVDGDALTVTVPAGEVMQQCVRVDIVDDEVALEGNETFQFYFAELDEGVVPEDPSEADVTIIDDDKGKIEFVW